VTQPDKLRFLWLSCSFYFFFFFSFLFAARYFHEEQHSTSCILYAFLFSFGGIKSCKALRTRYGVGKGNMRVSWRFLDLNGNLAKEVEAGRKKLDILLPLSAEKKTHSN